MTYEELVEAAANVIDTDPSPAGMQVFATLAVADRLNRIVELLEAGLYVQGLNQ